MDVVVLGGTVRIDPGAVAESDAAVRRQLREYERGERTTFDLTVATPPGFRGRVADAMAAIPYGETRTYGDLAATLETAPVAVGQACGRNPAPILVPCHRVVASDGSLRGYSEPGGVPLKRRLLAHERATRHRTT